MCYADTTLVVVVVILVVVGKCEGSDAGDDWGGGVSSDGDVKAGMVVTMMMVRLVVDE